MSRQDYAEYLHFLTYSVVVAKMAWKKEEIPE